GASFKASNRTLVRVFFGRARSGPSRALLKAPWPRSSPTLRGDDVSFGRARFGRSRALPKAPVAFDQESRGDRGPSEGRPLRRGRFPGVSTGHHSHEGEEQMAQVIFNLRHASTLGAMAPALQAGGGYGAAALPAGLAGPGMYIIWNTNTNNRYAG